MIFFSQQVERQQQLKDSIKDFFDKYGIAGRGFVAVKVSNDQAVADLRTIVNLYSNFVRQLDVTKYDFINQRLIRIACQNSINKAVLILRIFFEKFEL
jgi:hypothetical protein